MTPALYQQFGTEVLEALKRDGFDPSQVDVRLKGSSAGFFSGVHKTLPREEDLIGNPTAARRLQEWFGDRQNRPLRRPHDAMWRLGLEPVPSDFDLDFNSTTIVRTARAYWRTHHADRYRGDFMAGHGYLDRWAVMGSVPTLDGWARRWERSSWAGRSPSAYSSPADRSTKPSSAAPSPPISATPTGSSTPPTVPGPPPDPRSPTSSGAVHQEMSRNQGSGLGNRATRRTPHPLGSRRSTCSILRPPDPPTRLVRRRGPRCRPRNPVLAVSACDINHRWFGPFAGSSR